MAEIPATLDHRIDFDPAGDFEAFLRSVPAKWVVYLLADADGRPVQLLCVKNLRHSLKRRLGGDETIGISKRVNYRDLVRQIFWRRVDSAFEADWIYYEIARRIFPESYRGMVGFRPAWFVHVDPDAPFPRYTKTIDLTGKPGLYIGPVEDKHAAARLIELVEDCFDLCRYYNILVESPHGRACAYKEMGKCPAPCDGSISIEQYHRMIQWSAQTLIAPQDFINDQSQRMRQAAAELRFEIAGKIKSLIDQVSQLGKGAFRHTRQLSEFCYLSLQRGPRDGLAKLFLITPAGIEECAGLISEPGHLSDLMRHLLSTANLAPSAPGDPSAVELIGIVSHHLFTSKQTHGVFLPLASLTEKSLLKSYKDLLKQKQPDTEGEGVTKELTNDQC